MNEIDFEAVLMTGHEQSSHLPEIGDLAQSVARLVVRLTARDRASAAFLTEVEPPRGPILQMMDGVEGLTELAYVVYLPDLLSWVVRHKDLPATVNVYHAVYCRLGHGGDRYDVAQPLSTEQRRLVIEAFRAAQVAAFGSEEIDDLERLAEVLAL